MRAINYPALFNEPLWFVEMVDSAVADSVIPAAAESVPLQLSTILPRPVLNRPVLWREKEFSAALQYYADNKIKITQ